MNGGDVTTTSSTATLFNSGATTLNIGGAATALTLGASTGTTTINNLTLSLPTATAINAASAVTTIDSLILGGGYASTGVSIDNAGNVQAAGTLTVDGTSLLTGNVTAGSDIAVNGGDITTTNSSATLFNSGATTLNIGGAATTVTLGAGAGTTTLTNNLTANINDNSANALDIQEGTNNYININTTNSSENISFGNATTNPSFDFLGTGLTTLGGNLFVNGGTIATTQTTANVFNTTATTLNIGGAATTINLGATTGTATINNASIALPNGKLGVGTASPIAALDVTRPLTLGATGKALAIFNQIENQDILTASASGVPQFTIARNGNITSTGDLALNGGDITTTNTSASLFNTAATTLNIGGAATTLTLGASTGTTTIGNNLVVNRTSTLNGDTLISYDHAFNASGSATFSPNDSNDITFNTDANSTVVFNGLQTVNGNSLCLDGSNNLVICNGAPFGLQAAYNTGNTITTTDARDIAFTLSDTTTDSNFTITTAAGSTGYTRFALASGSNAAPEDNLF